MALGWAPRCPRRGPRPPPRRLPQVNVIQRRGRAGRVRPGIAVHLFPAAAYEQLAAHPEPEMRRTPLEDIVLQVQALGIPDAAEFLFQALDPPDPDAIGRAERMLVSLGCLAWPPEGEGEGLLILRPLGRVLASAPLHPRLGRLLVTGALLGCLGDVATVAAGLDHKSPFNMPMDEFSRAATAAVRLAHARPPELPEGGCCSGGGG